jgi:hypothetical protein
MSSVNVRGTITIKERTDEKSDCKECGPKTEVRDHEATYTFDITGDSGESPKQVEVTEGGLFQAVVTHIKSRQGLGQRLDARYLTAWTACTAVLEMLADAKGAPPEPPKAPEPAPEPSK